MNTKFSQTLPQLWMVTVNGVKYKGPYIGDKGRREAEIVAERTQGRSATYGGTKRNGLLKHKDFKDYVEVRRDTEAERVMRYRADEADRGNPQKHYIYSYD